MENYKGYVRSCDMLNEIDAIEDKLHDIGNANIINNSRIKEIEDDINRINEKVRATNRRNNTRSCIKGIKIFGSVLHFIFPYTLIATLLFGFQNAVFDTPFVRQEHVKVAKHEITMDVNGLVNDDVSYTKSVNNKNSAYYKTKWEKRNDGKYYRAVKEYEIGNYTLEALNDILNDPTKDIDGLFEQKGSTKYETKTSNEITQEDLEEPSSFKVLFHYDDTDVIVETQSIAENAILSVLYLAAYWWICLFLHNDLGFRDNYSLKRNIFLIQKQYRKVDLSFAKKLLAKEAIKVYLIKDNAVTITDPITNQETKIKQKTIYS